MSSPSRMTLDELRDAAEKAGVTWWGEEWTRADFIEALRGRNVASPPARTPDTDARPAEEPRTEGPSDDLLRLLAREAMSVGWFNESFFRAFIDEDDERAFSEADARFFAAVTPTVVLDLLDRERRVRDELRERVAGLGVFHRTAAQFKDAVLDVLLGVPVMTERTGEPVLTAEERRTATELASFSESVLIEQPLLRKLVIAALTPTQPVPPKSYWAEFLAWEQMAAQRGAGLTEEQMTGAAAFRSWLVNHGPDDDRPETPTHPVPSGLDEADELRRLRFARELWERGPQDETQRRIVRDLIGVDDVDALAARLTAASAPEEGLKTPHHRQALWDIWTGGERLAYGLGLTDGRNEAAYNPSLDEALNSGDGTYKP